MLIVLGEDGPFEIMMGVIVLSNIGSKLDILRNMVEFMNFCTLTDFLLFFGHVEVLDG